MTTEPDTPPAASPGENPLETIQRQLAELAKKPGADSQVQAQIAEALEQARELAQQSIAARQAAKDEAATAMQQVEALRTELARAKTIGVARDAGAQNPELVANLLAGVDADKLDDRVKALKESDPYLFATTPTPKAAGGMVDMTAGNTRPRPADPGLEGLSQYLKDLTGT